MSLETRRNKINATIKSVREVYRRDAKYRVYSVVSPTSGKPYQVITDWLNVNKILTVRCQLFTFAHKEQMNERGNHPADFSRYICCQFLASVRWAAKQVGKVVSFCKSEEAARRLLRVGGQLVRVQNLNGAVVWGTVRLA